MNKPTDTSPYTADFNFFDMLYGNQGEIFELIEDPNIKTRFEKCEQIIKELQDKRDTPNGPDPQGTFQPP